MSQSNSSGTYCGASSGQNPTEVLVVINGPRNRDLEAVCAEFPLVEWEWTPVAGKRNALRVGDREGTGEVVVLVDSDTLWTDGTLEELLKPFIDPRVGGVTTRQRILDPERNFLSPLGRLAGIEQVPLLDARPERAGTRGLPPGSHHRLSARCARRHHAGLPDQAVPRGRSRSVRRPDPDQPHVEAWVQRPSSSRRASSTPIARRG